MRASKQNPGWRPSMCNSRSSCQEKRGRQDSQRQRPNEPEWLSINSNVAAHRARRPLGLDRPMFEKLMTNPLADLGGYPCAVRFVNALVCMSEIEPLDVIWRLVSPSQYGLQRIRQILMISQVNLFTNDNIEIINTLTMPILRAIVNTPARYDPAARTSLHTLLSAVWAVPFIMQRLLEVLSVQKLEDTDSLVLFLLCSVYLDVVKTDHAENWSHLQKLVQSLLHQGVSRADRISTLIQQKPNDAEGNAISLCAIENQPGGRHANDYFDFKRIQITPIPDETDLSKASDNAFLPMANGEDGFLINDPVARMMDRAFRLLREDMVSMLRDNLSKPTPIVFASAAVEDFELRPQPCAIISFDAPVAVQKMSPSQKKEFWRKSRWLSIGSLICIAKERNPIVFGEVIHRQFASNSDYNFYDPNIKDVPFDVEDDGRDDGCEKRYVIGIAVESEASFRILAQLQSSKDDLEILQCCFNFFSYKPVLEALQCSSDFPFYNHLVTPSRLDCSSLSTEGESVFSLLKEFGEAVYEKALLLDQAQRRAFTLAVDANQKLSLIQGPPGTGKTLIGVLIALALAAKPLTRILCVCYTNHQLDQFLEALLDAGLTDIVRIGGRSSSDRLAKYVLSHKQGRSRPQSLEGHYRWRLHDVYQLMQELENDIEELTAIISRPLTDWPFFYAHLDPEMSTQFDLDDSNDDSLELGYDGQVIRTPADLWRNWRLGYMTSHISRSKHFLWTLNHQERLALLRTWQEEIRIEQINILAAKFVQYKQLREERISINQKNELPILMKAKVIGCTATGAAKYRALLNDVKCDVMIVEEAAELLEANVLGSINVYTEKVVMIGDHMQLRPKINNHRLSVESENGLDLNRSTFERLIIGGHPLVALQTQHRMRPEISAVVRRLTYHDLIDGDTVKNYPHLKGLKGDMIFVNHLGLERTEKTLSTSSRLVKSTSKINVLEAKLVVGTALYLCQQGYRTDQIVILTPYLGQLLEIREVLNRVKIDVILGESDQNALDEFGYETSVSLRSKRCSEQHGSIRVSTVDNFQGQQADIVLVSLVRNNPNGRIGFLKQPERLNVLLTRSRHGLILFGNRNCLAEACPLWDKIIESFRVTDGIPIICPRHDVETLVCDHLDFVTLTPHGGCTNVCEANLSCGHRCQSPCHDPDIIPHARCSVRFPDKCPYGHKVMRPCRQDRLPKCRQKVIENCPECNIQIVRKCHVPLYEAKCFNCEIEADRKRALLQIETDKVNKFAAMMEDQAKKLLDIEIDNARLASEMVIKKTEQNADILLHKALAQKKQAELDAIQTCHKIASDVASEIRKCHEDAEKRRLNEQARIDRLVREAERTSATLKAAHEAIIQHSQEVALEEVASLEADLDKESARIQETLRLAEDLRSMSSNVSCGICFEDYKRSDCVACPSIDTRPNQLHFFCRECFGQLVLHESVGDIRLLSLHSGMIVCPYARASECVSPPFSDATIAKWVSHAVFDQYMKSKEKVLEKTINDEFEQNFPARLELEIKRRTEEAPVLIRRKIIEFLTPACPRCHAAFIDFDGCAALTCHNCPCRFCAFCLHDCGDDSHIHVANCKFNPTANVYVSVEIWQDAHRRWIHDQIVAVLHTLSYSQIPQVLKDCEKELIDLGIDPQTLVAAFKVHKYSQ